VTACALASGGHRCRLLSPSRAFSSKSEGTPTSRCKYSKTGRNSAGRLTGPEKHGTPGTVSAARGRNHWARERVKAHTKRCREHHITRQHDTWRCDSTADDSFHASDDFSTDLEKRLIAELSVDLTLVGSGSTPKSSPASFSDVSNHFVVFLSREFSTPPGGLMTQLSYNTPRLPLLITPTLAHRGC